ncbi:hypothetical protein V8E53_007089 [Lactarius tabidus]
MRLFRALPTLSLLLGASTSSLDSRQSNAHPLDVREVNDVCAPVNVDLQAPNLLGNLLGASGVIDVCLCLSALPLFLETNVVALLAVDILGTQAITDLLTSLILADAPTNCNYPDNSVPACVNGNPCGFTCADGYTASPSDNPTECVAACTTPNIVCNGQCVAPGACPSSQATLTNKRRWVGSGSCTEMGHGWAACGVFGGGARAWECVNTARDLESCGGCVLPLTPFSPIGQDCTALPGVADVSCLSGECVVHRCMSGYSLSRDGIHCVSAQAHISRPHISVAEDDEEYLQAMRYGLEHRPL